MDKNLLKSKAYFIFSIISFFGIVEQLDLQAQDLKGSVIEALKETEIARAKAYLI